MPTTFFFNKRLTSHDDHDAAKSLLVMLVYMENLVRNVQKNVFIFCYFFWKTLTLSFSISREFKISRKLLLNSKNCNPSFVLVFSPSRFTHVILCIHSTGEGGTNFSKWFFFFHWVARAAVVLLFIPIQVLTYSSVTFKWCTCCNHQIGVYIRMAC